jgi:hypothetical protein
MRNGIIDGTKCQSEERTGNFFLLLCIDNTTEGSRKLQKALGYGTTKWNKWLDSLKLYLTMEEWFHYCNEKDGVNNAWLLIANALRYNKNHFQERKEQIDTVYLRCTG